jgi:CheY-like chemotaxis protein
MTDEASRTFRVLIVDDEPPVRAFVERVLRQRYETRVAADGPEALALAESEGPFDLLITDLAMPGMTGSELAQRLRRALPNLNILYLTGYSDRLFEARQQLWTGEAFLEKPVSVQGLLEAVGLLLVGRIPPPRPARVYVPDARIRFAQQSADLQTLSVTGARIQASTGVPVGSTWPLVLERQNETLHLTGRVVHCQRDEASAQAAATRHTIALEFLDVPARTRRALERVCSSAAGRPPESRPPAS